VAERLAAAPTDIECVSPTLFLSVSHEFEKERLLSAAAKYDPKVADTPVAVTS
jgi:hypothetical protein